jgi:hypothetical protein
MLRSRQEEDEGDGRNQKPDPDGHPLEGVHEGTNAAGPVL